MVMVGYELRMKAVPTGVWGEAPARVTRLTSNLSFETAPMMVG